jgi:hypothetical protein
VSEEDVVKLIAERCTELGSGGRMIDVILNEASGDMRESELRVGDLPNEIKRDHAEGSRTSGAET